MATFDESLVPYEERGAEFAPVLSAVIDPLSKVCTVSATSLPRSDMVVYLINCLSVMQVVYIPYTHIKSLMNTLCNRTLYLPTILLRVAPRPYPCISKRI